MAGLKHEIELALQPLVGLKLARMALAADMRTIAFGTTRARPGGGVIGEFALHIQCPWRIENREGLITGSDDLHVAYEASSGLGHEFDYEKGVSAQEQILRELLKGYDEKTRQIVNSTGQLAVEHIEADVSGGFSLSLSEGYRLSVFPDGSRREAWRFFVPSDDPREHHGRHFVIPHER